MKIITISREFGSGGRELGKRTADLLGYDYYDNEIITAVAKKSGLNADYVKNTLDNHGWKNETIGFRRTFASAVYTQALGIEMLLAQKKVIEDIAKLGHNCVIVGRNADVILRDYSPLNIFVCADMQAKIDRCRKRLSENEGLGDKELIKNIKRIDKIRSQTREMMSGSKWGEKSEYHLVINTTDMEIKALAEAFSEFAKSVLGRK